MFQPKPRLLDGLLSAAALVVCSLGLSATSVLGASSAASPAPAPDLAAQSVARYLEASKAPDSIGDGAYPAIKRIYESLPDQVVYQPADLSALGDLKMPIYVFGSGACSEDGASQRQHLLEIASHGYIAIAAGGIYSGPGVEIAPDGWQKHRDKTKYQSLGKAIDWAIAENSRPGSPLYGRIATDKVAVSGYSCGGVQAIKYAGDPRVSTIVMMNSGILSANVPQSGEMEASKSLLDKIRVPIIYVLGGPRDIAYPNGMDDFGLITTAPVFAINTDVTHAGTYDQPNGGRAARAVVAWLDWQLRGDLDAKKWFVGPDCRLCRDPQWTIEGRNFREVP